MIQYPRSYEVAIGPAGGTGLGFTSQAEPALQIAFEIEKTAASSPNKATIKLFNLSAVTEAKIARQYDRVLLLAGYGGQNSLVFTGNIQSLKRSWEGTDTISEITAGDGDFDYHRATINATLAAGANSESVVAAALATFVTTVRGPQGVSPAAGTRLRGKVLTGATRDVLTTMARDIDAQWSIQDGQLVVVGIKDVLLPNMIPFISDQTGLIGYPEVTEKGVKLKTLLMPTLRIGGALQLQTVRAAVSAPMGARQDPNGVYKVVKLKHVGDFRGEEWCTEVECVRI